MPGSVNINVNLITYNRLMKRKLPDDSWSVYMNKLLDIADQVEGITPTTSVPSNPKRSHEEALP